LSITWICFGRDIGTGESQEEIKEAHAERTGSSCGQVQVGEDEAKAKPERARRDRGKVVVKVEGAQGEALGCLLWGK